MQLAVLRSKTCDGMIEALLSRVATAVLSPRYFCTCPICWPACYLYPKHLQLAMTYRLNEVIIRGTRGCHAEMITCQIWMSIRRKTPKRSCVSAKTYLNDLALPVLMLVLVVSAMFGCPSTLIRPTVILKKKDRAKTVYARQGLLKPSWYLRYQNHRRGS